MTPDAKLQAATQCLDADPDQTYRICEEVLKEDPENAAANTLAGVVMTRADRLGAALAFFSRAAEIKPKRAEMWNNMGTVFHEMRKPAKAREHFKRALELKPDDALYMCNVGVTYSDEAEHEEALRWVAKAEKVNPAVPMIQHAKAFASLALGNWADGWKAYDSTLGGRFRKQLDFGGADWDGSAVDTLVVYGEQGIGDEIMFASCIADVMPLVKHLIIECDPRLESLYRRSFPTAEVYGTRRLDRPWLEGRKIDAQVACGSLPRFFRPTPDSCPRTPYLVPDESRRIMWRALFKSYGKPVIGLTWSGGRYSSQLTKRRVGLESLRPYIEATDAIFVSLQYEDPREEIKASGLPVLYFEEALKERDFDGLAAMISELDGMFGIHTTAHHIRGSLGMPSTVLVPYQPLWLYNFGDRIPFYQSQVYHRQRKDERWIDCVRRAL